MTWSSRPVRLVALAAAALLLSACGGSGERTDEDGVTTIVVGAAPVVDLAPLWHAQESGLFEEQGLKVETRVISGGAEAIPAMLAGDVDMIFTGYTPVLLARQRGLDVGIVMGSNNNDVAEDQPYGLWTSPDSGVRTVADLEGATIGVNTLGSVAHLFVVAAFDDIGLGPDDYELLEVPFPDVPAAIDQGRVDAAWVAEPGRARVIEEIGGRFVGSEDDPTRMTDVEDLQDVPLVGYAARGDEDPEVVEAFRAAMTRAMDEVNADQSIALDLAADNAEIPDELLGSVAVSVFEPVELDALERFEALMVRHGLMDEPSDDLVGLFLAP